jgi:hypothetical protein
MTHLVFAMGRLLELYMSKRLLFMIARDLEMVHYATRRVAQALAEAAHLQLIKMYWNTAMEQNNDWFIEFEVRRKDILNEVWRINGPRWIVHIETRTRFTYKLIRLNPILFNQQRTTLQSLMMSTALNPPQSIWNSFIPILLTISIFLR